MHTAPSSAPTSPETDYHVVSDLSSSIESLTLSESLSLDTSTGTSRRSSGGNTSEEYEIILTRGSSDSGASLDFASSPDPVTTDSTDSVSSDGHDDLLSIPPRYVDSSDETDYRPTPTPRRRRRRGPAATPTPAYLPGSDSDSDSSTTTKRPSRDHSGASYSHSISSASEARESINSFFNDPEFTSDKSNKLRLWQSLCIEFGLVDLEGSLPDLPSLSSDSSSSRSVTPTHRVPLPTSLTKANQLLKSQAHVNIKEYQQARLDPTRQGVGAFADLVYPSTSALIRATRKKRMFADLTGVKGEWLDPLLRNFSFRR